MSTGKVHYAYSIVVSAFLVQMTMVTCLSGVPIMLADITDTLQLTATEAGSLTAAFTAFYGFLGFVWGFVADKIGARKVLIVSLILCFLGLFGFGMFGTSYLSCCILYAVAGVGCAAFTVATLPRLWSRWFSTKKRHMPSSVAMMGGVFMGMIGGIVIPKLVGAFGWQTALEILACFIVIVMVVVIVFVRNEPKDKGLLPCGVDDADAKAHAELLEKADARGKESKGIQNYIDILKMPFTWKLIIHTIFYQMAYIAINSFLPMAIMSAGYDRVEAGFVVTVYNLFQLIAMFVWGKVADKIEPRKSLSLSLVVWSIGIIVMIFCYENLTTAYVAIAITGLGLGAPGLMMSIMADYFPPESVGTGGGVSSTIGTIGRTLGPIIAGALVDMAGGSFAVIFVFAAVCQVIALFIPFTFGNIRDKQETSKMETTAG